MLQSEIEKAKEAKRARDLRVMGAIMVGSACGYALFVGVCALAKLGSLSDFNLPQQMSTLVAGALTALLLLSGRFGHRLFPVVSRPRTRLGIYAAGMFLVFGWLGLFLQLALGRFEFGFSQLIVAFFWAVTPWGALVGCIYGLERAAVEHAAAVRS